MNYTDPSNGNIIPPPPAPPEKGIAVKIAVILALLALGKVASMVKRGPVGTAELRLVCIVIGEITLLFFAIWKVEWVFYALLFYLPFNHMLPGDFGTAVNITNILIAIIVFGLFFRSVKEGGHFFVGTELDRWIGLYLALIILSFFRASLHWEHDWFMLATLVKRFCTPIFMYYLASWVIRNREGVKDCMFVIMLTTLMVAFLSTKDTWTPTHFSWERREEGIIRQANILASFMIYYMFYFVSFFRTHVTTIKYWLLLPCLYPCIRTVMLTFSRGGYVAFVAAILFIAYRFKKALFFVVCIFLMVVWFVPEPFLPGSVIERLKGTVRSEKTYYTTSEDLLEESARGRLLVWRGGVKMILTHPLIGVGYGRFPFLIEEYAPAAAGMDAHNAYILIAAEMGIPALIIFLGLTIQLFKHACALYRFSADRLYAGLGLGFATGMVGFWAANFFGCRFNTTETIAYFWVLASLIMLVRKMELERLKTRRMEGNVAPAWRVEGRR